MRPHRDRALSLLALVLCLFFIALANSPYPPLWTARHTVEYRVLRRDGHWRLLGLDSIYERDALVPG